MYDCSVRIVTQTERNVTEVCASVKVKKVLNGFQVFYLQDGDEVAVLVGRDTFTMKRSGETELFAVFSRCEPSRMTVFFADSQGDIPVTTRSYTVERARDGVAAELSYVIGEENKSQFFKIKFIMTGILEEK